MVVAYCIVFRCKLKFVTVLKQRQARKVRNNRKTGDEENAFPCSAFKYSVLVIYLILRFLSHLI